MSGIKEFDPTAAMHLWMNGGSRSGGPEFVLPQTGQQEEEEQESDQDTDNDSDCDSDTTNIDALFTELESFNNE